MDMKYKKTNIIKFINFYNEQENSINTRKVITWQIRKINSVFIIIDKIWKIDKKWYIYTKIGLLYQICMEM